MRNIQQIGAQAAIIEGGIHERNYTKSAIKQEDRWIHDDGTNFSVHIPALLITESSGKQLRD